MRPPSAAEWNSLPKPTLHAEDMERVLRVLAKSTLWMPRAFVGHLRACNLDQREQLISFHPARHSDRAALERYFDGDYAIGVPFVRRLIASERKGLKSWLHRYHESAGVILDDNRIPKRLWSYAWCGRNYAVGEKGPWKSHGFHHYEASHVLPHKREMHEAFFHEVFEEDIRFDPSLLFLAAWNNLLVDKRVAGLTDSSPVVTAILLNEIERRYDIDLGFLGRRRKVVLNLEIAALARQIDWWQEPADFRPIWKSFGADRFNWVKARLTEPRYRSVVPLPVESAED